MQILEIEVNKYQDTGDRFSTFIEKSGLRQARIAQITGIAPGTISRIAGGTQVLGDNVITSLTSFFDVDPDWLKFGVGKMGSAQLLNSWPEANEPVNELKEPVSPYNARHKGTSDKLNMWWVPAKAEAGFIRGFAARLFPSMIQRGSMPMIQGECFAFEIDGFSMFPEFMPGTYVLCTALEDAGWLRKGRSYVFQTAEGLIIKYFDRIEDNKIYTTAANNNFNPVVPIPVEEIQQLYNIEFSMNRPKPQ